MKTMIQDIQTGNQYHPVKTGTEKELLRLQEELKSVKENASRFTSVVAHDLQAPLRMITGFLDLLSGRYSQQLDEKALQYIGFAVQGAGKMKQLIKDLQLYTSLSNDNSPQEKINLTEVVNDIMTKNAATWEPVNLSIHIGDLPVVVGRKNQISLLLEELLLNAVKFSDEKPPHVSVSAKDVSPGWRITVADQGIGFDPAFAENIFEIFRRLHPDNGRFAGTGIGLALCKRICELHGWDIRAVSVPGKGAEFILTIPVLNQSSKSC